MTIGKFVHHLFLFAWKQALCCVFPAILFAAMAVTRVVDVPYIPRYDVILLVCLATQAGMVFSRLETKDKLKVITMFHLIGLGLELFKVNMGSWSHPSIVLCVF